MAFISDKHKFIFLHIPKNAGTTISDALTRIHGEQLYGIGDGAYDYEGVGLGVPRQFRPSGIDVHDNYKQIIEKYPKAKDYQVLAVVGNPWERIFSFWKHKVRRGDLDLDHSLSFADALRKSNVLLLQPQLWWFVGLGNVGFFGNKVPNARILRKEYLADDFALFLDDIGIEMPEMNRLNTDPNKENYRDHYDEYGVDLIKEFYRAEIERFGYEF